MKLTATLVLLGSAMTAAFSPAPLSTRTMAGAATTTSLGMGGKPAKQAKSAEDDLELTRKVISGFLGDVEQVVVPAAKAPSTDEPADEEDSDEPKKNIISRAKDKIKKKLSKD